MKPMFARKSAAVSGAPVLPALTAWRAHQATKADAAAAIQALNAKTIAFDLGVLKQATVAAAEVAVLRERRRRIMATAMLDGGRADTVAVDAELAAAEAGAA